MKAVVTKDADRTYIELQNFTPYDIGECDLRVMETRSINDDSSEITGSYNTYDSYCDDVVSDS